ncbi:MAG: hypothetical protein U1F87_11240 [Kiritimatiellia bacterium]
MFSGRAKSFGGAVRLLVSSVLDTILFTLLAPVAMIFRGQFVWDTHEENPPARVTQRRKGRTRWTGASPSSPSRG